ncbi:hypothetical protein TCAL_07684 [Tigriopus californicus]|uniref:Bifunctional coenzyme A synthase n=1 Tax=Tigriopus californicus TaxID=6832 RepID=A0A553NT93_TIGCA|nr:bifunctional coenzyme A synthase-like isoform X2 [Tigriopus californicus]TRY68647.1 hypothetical protein TCAL_07684 [Tigriopus californicus]|eukprot:TCALIF_07684-PA protein Name:"Similar to COASY Bifunctional coenzyme A synthase (Sus scrofa)" AED:0.06 eAED:0.06 QI:228/1/1/1/0.75/0.6/5/398/530
MAPAPASSLLLVLATPLAQCGRQLRGLLPKLQSKYADLSRLYVHIIPPNLRVHESAPSRGQVVHAAKRVYGASAAFPEVDVRLLLHGFKSRSSQEQMSLGSTFKMFLSPSTTESSVMEAYLKAWHPTRQPSQWEGLDVEPCARGSQSEALDSEVGKDDDRSFEHVVIGGTFDRLHAGHKILLVEAVLRSERSLTIGVTENEMLASKKVRELILPTSERIKVLENFLQDCDSTLEYKLEPIVDPFGPSIVDPGLELIVGSEESAQGCEKVNEKRQERGLKPLDIIIVGVEADPVKESDLEEVKVSSSSMRLRLLGSLLKAPSRPWDKSAGPYIVGLTGGSASGKSSISRRLEKLGAKIVDCDKLGHKAYQKGTDCLDQVVQAFGADILDQEGNIDRRVLGSKVFGNSENRAKLEGIVWPEIRRMAEQEIQAHFLRGCSVVVLDAAVLLAANWHAQMCHEVWVSFVDQDEAIKRIMERDGRSQDEAEKRLASQMTNADYVRHAHVVFCTKWAGEFTQKQVEKAWTRLQSSLG